MTSFRDCKTLHSQMQECIRDAETADSNPGARRAGEFTPALQRIDGGMTTSGKLRRTVLVGEEGQTGRWERVLTVHQNVICKEKIYSISTVLMGKKRCECAMLAPSRISPPTNELGSSCKDPE